MKFVRQGICYVFTVALGILPACIAWRFDPTMRDKWHPAVLGALAVTFAIVDYFFKEFKGTLKGLSFSAALPVSSAEMLRTELSRLDTQIAVRWWCGICLRVGTALSVALLASLGTTLTSKWLLAIWLMGYICAGFSLPMMLYFWSSYRNADKFSQDFKFWEQQEIRRRAELAELRAQVYPDLSHDSGLRGYEKLHENHDAENSGHE